MIGSAFAKYAKENGMKVSNGAAYGNFRGYAAAFTEGSGYKLVNITTVFSDPSLGFELQQKLTGNEITKQYRLGAFSFSENCISLRFNDTVGTMKCIRAFFDWFIPLLDEASASAYNVCPACGMPVGSSGEWLLIDGTTVRYMHTTCSANLQDSVLSEEQRVREEDNGSVLLGTVGAAIGGLIGAAVWAIVLSLGYMAALVGLLIGWLEDKGYTLLHGKNCRGKVAILVIIAILAVIIGTFGGEVINVIQMINDGELPGYTYAQAIPLVIAVFIMDSGAKAAIIGNLLMGLLFAGLGMFGVLRQAKRSTAGTKFIKLP